MKNTIILIILCLMLVLLSTMFGCNSNIINDQNEDIKLNNDNDSFSSNYSASIDPGLNEISEPNTDNENIATDEESTQNAKEKSIMDYEWVEDNVSIDRPLIKVNDFYEKCLDNPYGYFIKVKATEKYENILTLNKYVDKNDYFKGRDGYDDLPKENGHAVTEVIDPFMSYMLTDVIVQNIYYLGDKISFNENDIIAISESCYIASSGSSFPAFPSGGDVLFMRGNVKMMPEKEYLIFGYKYSSDEKDYSENGKYCSFGYWEGIAEINGENRVYSDEHRKALGKSVEEYYQSSNGEQVINDYIEQYRQYLIDIGAPEWSWEKW